MISIPVFQCCLFLGNQYNVLPNMEFLSFRALCVTTASLEKEIRTLSPIQILIMISRLGHLCFMSQLKTFDLIVFTIVR